MAKVRCEDALRFLEDALLVPPKSKQRQALLEGALLTYYFGLKNRHKDLGRGRPAGTGRPHRSDDAALQLMAGLARDFGETRPHTLARLVVDGGAHRNGASRNADIKRLAARWKVVPK